MYELLLNDDLSDYELLNTLKSLVGFRDIYQCRVRHYLLEKHTLLVLGQYEKYFFDVKLPIKKSLFKLFLALHDIGKPRAFSEGNLQRQHIYTVELIRSIQHVLPFSISEIDIITALAQADAIGLYMQNLTDLLHTINKIEELRGRTSLNKIEFLKLLVIYYQCDTGSYTVDAGGLAFLEHLYVYVNAMKFFDKKNMRLTFSSTYENKYIELEKKLLL